MDLTSVLTPDVMAPILANPEVQQRLMPYLPSGESLPQSSEELSNTLSSPQFQQVQISDPIGPCGRRSGFVDITSPCVFTAGYEHVQQRAGVGPVGPADEPVRFASGGRRRGEQRRSVWKRFALVENPKMFALDLNSSSLQTWKRSPKPWKLRPSRTRTETPRTRKRRTKT